MGFPHRRTRATHGVHIFYTSNDDESGTHILERMGAFLTRHLRLREEGAR